MPLNSILFLNKEVANITGYKTDKETIKYSDKNPYEAGVEGSKGPNMNLLKGQRQIHLFRR